MTWFQVSGGGGGGGGGGGSSLICRWLIDVGCFL
mgnify:FL=1|jgi:hypothetical protein